MKGVSLLATVVMLSLVLGPVSCCLTTPATPELNLSVTPAAVTNNVGERQQLEVVVTKDGAPLSGVEVRFEFAPGSTHHPGNLAADESFVLETVDEWPPEGALTNEHRKKETVYQNSNNWVYCTTGPSGQAANLAYKGIKVGTDTLEVSATVDSEELKAEAWIEWIPSLTAIRVEEITIGPEDGVLSFSFAIFADPQDSVNKLEEAVDKAKTDYPYVEFVIVLGDIIEGGEVTPGAYQAQFYAAKTALDGLDYIPYIPMLGNHDVWCNLTGGVIPSLGGDTIPLYAPGADPLYPEQIFSETFAEVYQSLSAEFSNWSKQYEDGVPIDPNPYDSAFPPIYLQNFAFDYGQYHFICLDLCSRKDFDNINYYDTPFGNIPIFGYADLNDFADGTLGWLDEHLAGLSLSQRQSIILFTHHPPVYKLEVDFIMSITLEGDDTLAFTEDEYNQLIGLFKANGCEIIHWFAGHYHLEGFGWGAGMNIIQWYDSVIGSDVSIIPSVMVCDEFSGFSVPSSTAAIINGAYAGDVEPNPTGWIAIVHVRVP